MGDPVIGVNRQNSPPKFERSGAADPLFSLMLCTTCRTPASLASGCFVQIAAQDFMPQSGRMALWQMPEGLRVEHALQSGSEIPPFYDSMIAKLIGFGATRDEARRKLVHGLGETAALGGE